MRETAPGPSGGEWTKSSRAVAYFRAYTNDAFTLGNVLELGWEVIPFSFVVDWGIGVGDYLSSLDALKGMAFVAGTVTHKETFIGAWNHATAPETTEIPATIRQDAFSRSLLTSIPYPSRPKLSFSKSYRTLTNAVALLWAVNKKCSTSYR